MESLTLVTHFFVQYVKKKVEGEDEDVECVCVECVHVWVKS